MTEYLKDIEIDLVKNIFEKTIVFLKVLAFLSTFECLSSVSEEKENIA
jgi:hypothetical protein